MAEKLSQLSDATKATIRTTIQAVITSAAMFVLSRFTDLDVDPADPVFVAVIGVLTVVVYRLSLYLVDKFPAVGTILFGVNEPPSYGDSQRAA